MTKYQLDLDDYKVEQLRGMQLIREQVKEHADAYRPRMEKYYNSRHDVGVEKLSKVGGRVLLSSEKTKRRYPKLTFEWDGPFRVLEVYDTSALISRIGTNEEPLKIQVDLLRFCPKEMSADMPRLRTRTKRHRQRSRVVRVSRVFVVKARRYLDSFFPRAERVFDIDDTLNCLHEEFRCQSQKLLLLPEVPQMELSDCNVSVSVIAGDVIPRLPEPAYSHRVETVLEAARIIAIYQGCGTMREKILWILDPDRKLSRQRA